MYRFIALLAPAVLLMGLGLDLYIPSEHIMMTALNLTFPQVQLTLSIYMYSFGLGQLIMGPVVDTWGRQLPLIFSLIIYVLGSLLAASTDQFSLLLWGRCLQAFGACGAMICVFALIRDQYDGKQAISAFTYIRGISTLAPIIAPSIGAFLSIRYGWRSDFYFLALFGMFAIMGSFFITYPPRTPRMPSFFVIKDYIHILRNPIFRCYALAAGLVQTVMFGYFSSSPVVYLSLLSCNELEFALLFSINASSFLIIAFGLAKWMAKIGINKSITLGAGLFLTAGIVMFVIHSLIGMSLLTMLIPSLIASSGCAFSLGSASSGALEPFKSQSGKAAALLGCMEFMIGGFLGSLVVFYPMKNTLPFGICLILVSIGVGFCIRKAQQAQVNSARAVSA